MNADDFILASLLVLLFTIVLNSGGTDKAVDCKPVLSKEAQHE
jgi:hypothetical protein